jgi:hypothetical protein
MYVRSEEHDICHSTQPGGGLPQHMYYRQQSR